MRRSIVVLRLSVVASTFVPVVALAQWQGFALSAPVSSLVTHARAFDAGNAVGTVNSRAAIWEPAVRQYRLLDGDYGSDAFDILNDDIVGHDETEHATLWRSLGKSRIDLHPGQYFSSVAAAIDDGKQYGWVTDNTSNHLEHAVAWSGSSESVVSLERVGIARSAVFASQAGLQVGFGATAIHQSFQAMLWHGSAESGQLIGPASARWSRATGTDGSDIVGIANFVEYPRAWLWRQDGKEQIDLHPPWAISSEARGTIAGFQVGVIGLPNSAVHATVWRGSAESAVSLHQFLPTEFQSPFHRYSFAYGANVWNGRVYIVGHAQNASAQYVPVLWVGPVPELSSAYSVSVMLAALHFRVLRRRKGRLRRHRVFGKGEGQLESRG
jgi:hypothetical protein